MSLRMLIGRSGSGKTAICLNEIQNRLMENPEGAPLIYIVPEQMTFLSEYRLSTNSEIRGMIRAQVYSFPRLAWRILQETGGISRYHLNSTGINMLIRKIIEDQKENLKLFQRSVDKNGFIQQVEQMMVEFKRYCIRPEELSQVGSQSKVLQDKLNDLEIIYKHFEESILNKYIDSEDYFRLLAEKIASSSYLKDTEIYIDGFYHFTPQEYRVIGELMKHCTRVTIAMTTDELYRNSAPDELHLFRMSGTASHTICELAQMEGVQIEKPILLTETKKWSNLSLRHLEEKFDARPLVPFKEQSAINVCQAVNRRAEIEGIAREIQQLVRTKGYRYRDIAVLIRNGQNYHDIVEPVFYDHQIPYFIDQKRTMLNHPLIEFIRSSLEVINGFWRYEPIFRAIKTELLFPLQENGTKMREKTDNLENYVLAYGIKGNKWTKKDRWIFRRIRGLEFGSNTQTDDEKETEKELNELRTMITAPILRLSRRLKKADSGRKFCEAIYLYLEELDIPSKLENWKMDAEKNGNLVKMREHEQVWNAVIDLLDQYVEILGEESISVKQFASILEAGFDSLSFSLIPPALDQVLIADLEKSRFSEIKAAFVIGLNEGVLPAKISDDGILADEDREILGTLGMNVAPSSRIRLLDENFLAYKAFTTPSEALYISYPLANEEGKALIPSTYIKRIRELFPKRFEHFYVTDPAELLENGQLHFVSNPNTTLSYLTSQLQLKKKSYPINDFWWDVYNYYVKGNLKHKAQKVLSSLFYSNQTKKLSIETADELYGDTIQASVSRMELFNSCPFNHFIRYGLKLQDRKIYRLEAPDIGDLFHAALKHISEIVNEQNITWANLSKVQCEKMAKQAVDALAPKLLNEILLSSERHHYIKRKLEQIITRASLVLSEHAKSSGFSPIELELAFGPNGKLPPLSFSLKKGKKMELVGRIDRVDKAIDENGSTFLRVLDYKSSDKELNLNEVYYGLSLQMLTYLDIIMTYSNELVETKATPAGMLYFHVHNPMVNSTKMLTIEQIEVEMMKKFKMNGLLLNDQNVIRLMDQSLESGNSQIISAGIKVDGTLTKNSKVASMDEFENLRQYVRNMYEKTGNAIIDGNVEISPYKMKDKKNCSICPYKSICQFDESMENNCYRILTPQSNEKVLELIGLEVNGNE
ncbi:helicase-exonuclease AddAB subunit AddB [Neobacillus sp. PS3-40]|uniref:helicase-exonuclease AddAB subunit AddB n=1 Tax=Neobacillus sp. PS3-40 TaxID=3070679 RepID=UPI0027E0C10A|nr:helicase-exonuclease AddAB subunit AddB [Neobacillus sp. PS3-40]WML43320.1 helicase-exonuclease AddAB subunit AddB [Neobacillus sp. PS3-40]